MQTLKSYLYPKILKVRIPDSGVFKIRNKTVYAHTIKIHQGIDNPIQVYVLNQDNKSIDLTGNQILVTIQDPVEEIIVASYQIVWTDISKGFGMIVIDKGTTNLLTQRYYKLAVKKIETATNKESPMYIDDNFGVMLDLEVLPGYF